MPRGLPGTGIELTVKLPPPVLLTGCLHGNACAAAIGAKYPAIAGGLSPIG